MHIRRRQGGFTLLELAVVVFIIGVIAAITFPQVLPIIMYSETQSTARQLAGFGRSAVAQATMLRERITVRVDLDQQEVYAVRWVVPVDEKQKQEQARSGEVDQLELLKQYAGTGVLSPEVLASLRQGEAPTRGLFDREFDPEEASMQMGELFDRFARRATEERAKNVKHTGFLDEIGPLFDRQFSLDNVEPVEEEIVSGLLGRMRISEDVRLQTVVVGEKAHTRGVVEIELSPLGLTENATFYVGNASKEEFTVTWNAVTGATSAYEGRRNAL